MPDDYYAIVVGIRDYPKFGATPQEARHLRGPVNDAKQVYEWLTDPAKGGVPKSNAKLICTEDAAAVGVPAPPKPKKQEIIDAFSALEDIAQNQQDGQRVGRRLYIYMSGHGFAPKRKEGAVFMADATRVQTHHVFTSRWLEWFYNAEYFDEFVLWMDCCMVFDLSIIPESAGFRVVQGTRGGSIFAAFAAKFPLQAVERSINGEFHGVFTHALLEGLNGAAADPKTKQVTSETLKRYLIHHMKTFMDPADLEDESVSKEPDFAFDDDMVLCTVPTVPQATVFLHPRGATTGNFKVITGAPPTEVAAGTFNGTPAQIQLPVGIYFVKAGGASAGFEVTGAGQVDVHV